MEGEELKEYLNCLDRRLDWEEQIHRNHEADGNVYKWDYENGDKFKLIGLGIGIGLISVLAFVSVFNFVRK